MAPSRPTQKQAPPRTPPRRPTPKPTQPQEEVVDPVWLLKALGVTAAVAVFCAWVALCLLYLQGSWQLVLHPSKSIDKTPAALNIPFEEVHFGSSETGQPLLTGWWIPATEAPGTQRLEGAPKYAGYTILYLHDGTGSLSAAVPTLGLLHSLGINIFALDYRGFGLSDASSHPTSASMAADVSTALSYLAATRHIATNRVVPYGAGLGASLAVGLARNHGELPAVILDNPDPDPTLTAVGAHPSGIVPIRLLYHQHFEIAGPLASLPTPKLLLAGGPNAQASDRRNAELQSLFRAAANPAISVLLPESDYQAAYAAALSRFLDQYLPRSSGSR